MKRRRLVAAASVAAALGMAGLAIAQGVWPTVTKADLQVCRPTYAQAHAAEQGYIQIQMNDYCQRGSQYFDEQNCQTMKDWLAETRARDPLDWYYEGNGRCEGSDYPCFGPELYNTPRTGEEAQYWSRVFADQAADAATIRQGMEFWEAANIADNCTARVWLEKYRGGAAPQRPAAGVAQPARPPAAAPASPPPAASPVAAFSPEVAACVDDGEVTASRIGACVNVFAGLTQGGEEYQTLAISLMQMYADIGKPLDALSYGDLLAGARTGAEATLSRCLVRVLVKWDLDAALSSCNSLGPSNPTALEASGYIHLLAGRWQEAWSAFNAAYDISGSPETLYLRGLASAALGRMADGLRDMADGEAAAPGTAQANELDGISLAAVTQGKPLAPPEAFAPAIVPAIAQTRPAAATPAPAPRTNAAAPVAHAIIKFAPDAPRGDIGPLNGLAASACVEEIANARNDSQGWKGTPEEAALRLGLLQRTLFGGRCAGHPDAAQLIAEAEREIAASAASAASAFTDAKDTSPDVINCVEPMAPNNPRNKTGSPALHNSCNFPVTVAYCNVSPAAGSWAELFACGGRRTLGMDVIPANGATPAVFGREIQHFACRQPAGPVLTYVAGKGLDGFCK